jgi:hypothetical protein
MVSPIFQPNCSSNGCVTSMPDRVLRIIARLSSEARRLGAVTWKKTAGTVASAAT